MIQDSSLSDLEILADDLVLFHGSGIPGTTDFKPAENATFGKGVYLTSSREKAEGYARVRQETGYNGEISAADGKDVPDEFQATVYEFFVDGLRFLDMRTAENMERVFPLYVKFLEENSALVDTLAQELAARIYTKSGSEWGKNATVKFTKRDVQWIIDTYKKRTEEESDEPLNRDYFTCRDSTVVNDLFTRFVTSLGYDGIVGLEGGDRVSGRNGYHIGAHDTWVVFDPTKITLQREYQKEFPGVRKFSMEKHYVDPQSIWRSN